MDRLENLDPRLNIAVVGGGYAGFAAAVTLAGAGGRVTVYEAAPVPGGRARRVPLQGVALDNGQHLLLGACHQLMDLVAQVGAGTAAWRRCPLELDIRGGVRLAARPWPAPLGLLAGLLGARGLTLGQRWRLAAFLRRVPALARQPGDRTVTALLAAERQDTGLCRGLWEPLCLAALNTPAGRASARVFLRLLADTLCAGPADADLLLPRTDLSQLFPEPAADWLRRQGHDVRVGETVTALEAATDTVTVVTPRHRACYDRVVCAVGPHQLAPLARHCPPLAAAAADVAHFDWQPISTIWLGYPAEVRLPVPMLGLADARTQWIFDRGALGGPPGLLAAVISGRDAYPPLPSQQLGQAVADELGHRLGLPPPRWHRAITEKRATFSCDAGLKRPAAATGHRCLWLAGDYIDGPYPATLEGAVRSGVQAARQLIASTSNRQPPAN